MAACVFHEGVEEVAFANCSLSMIVQEVGEAGESKGGCQRPARPVPLALVTLVAEGEFRLALFDKRRAVGCLKPLRTPQFGPARFEAGVG